MSETVWADTQDAAPDPNPETVWTEPQPKEPPNETVWMNTPQGSTPNKNPGLDWLGGTSGVMVNRRARAGEYFIKMNLKFEIMDHNNQLMFLAQEDTGCCMLNCCGTDRAFRIDVTDSQKQPLFVMERPLACATPWFCCVPNTCCMHDITVSSADGEVIGHVVQQWQACGALFEFQDATGQEVFQLDGPACFCATSVSFPIIHEGAQITSITKEWAGIGKELFTLGKNFSVQFPQHMPPDHRLLLLAGLFLVNFMYFEHRADSRSNTWGGD
eukprot:227355_1